MNVKAAKASQRFHMLARFPFALPLLNVMLPHAPADSDGRGRQREPSAMTWTGAGALFILVLTYAGVAVGRIRACASTAPASHCSAAPP